MTAVTRPAGRLAAYTYEEYRRFEDTNPARHEYVDGQILAMAGGTPAHARLQAAVLFALERRLEGRPCQPFPSDLRVKVVATGVATYPDVTVVCGSVETDAEDPRAVTNPTVIVEVLSDSTEAYDRGDKFEHYRQIPTFRRTSSSRTASGGSRPGGGHRTEAGASTSPAAGRRRRSRRSAPIWRWTRYTTAPR